MASYIILEPQDQQSPTDKAVFIRDGFHLGAFIFPVIWLLWSRLWLEAALTLLIITALGVIATLLNAGDLATYMILAVSFFIGAEFSQWRIKKLQRKGYVEKTVIEARNPAEAEIRYYYLYANSIKTAPSHNEQSTIAQNPLVTPPILSHSYHHQIGLVGHRGET